MVYDSVGKDSFMGSLDCLKLRGLTVLPGLALIEFYSGGFDHRREILPVGL